MRSRRQYPTMIIYAPVARNPQLIEVCFRDLLAGQRSMAPQFPSQTPKTPLIGTRADERPSTEDRANVLTITLKPSSYSTRRASVGSTRTARMAGM
jgi:hypothetical protein